MNKEKLRELQANQRVKSDLSDLIDALLEEEPEAKASGFPLMHMSAYWTIVDGEVRCASWSGGATSIRRLKSGLVFLTKEAAQADLVWQQNQHALMCEADGGNWWARSCGGLFVIDNHCPPNYPTFSTRQDCELAYYKVLKNSDAIKAHLTYQSKAVKFT